jgi:uncharacterized protein (DUF697 family)
MSTAKKLISSMLGLLIGLILLMLTLRLLKGVPVIGGIAADAQHLAQSGTING